MTAFVQTVRLLAAIGIRVALGDHGPGAKLRDAGRRRGSGAAGGPAGQRRLAMRSARCGRDVDRRHVAGARPGRRQEDWRKTPAVVALGRRDRARGGVPQEDALASVRRFAAGYQGEERAKILTQVFVGVFDTPQRGAHPDRARHQALLSPAGRPRPPDGGRLESAWRDRSQYHRPQAGEQRAALQQQIGWDSRVFDDRQRLPAGGLRAAAG